MFCYKPVAEDPMHIVASALVIVR